MSSNTEKWDSIQLLSYPDWINYYLHPINLHLDDISQLADGVLLVHLLESISGKKFKRYVSRPKFLQQKIDNINISLQFLRNEMNLRVIGCNPQDIVSGNTKQISGIIFLLVQYKKRMDFREQEISDEQSEVFSPVHEIESEASTVCRDSLDKIEQCIDEESTSKEEISKEESKWLPSAIENVPKSFVDFQSLIKHEQTNDIDDETCPEGTLEENTDNMVELSDEAISPVATTDPVITEEKEVKIRIEKMEESKVNEEREEKKSEETKEEPETNKKNVQEEPNEDKMEKKEEDTSIYEESTEIEPLCTKNEKETKTVKSSRESRKRRSGSLHRSSEGSTTGKKRRKGKKKKKYRASLKYSGRSTSEIEAEKMVQEKQRGVIANEILQTERFYVCGLTILINSFLCPLREKSLISTASIRRIFSDIEVLFRFNCQFLENLESRMKNWEEHQHKLGDLFLREVEYLKMYTMYVNNYNESVKAVAECKKNSKFREFVEKVRYSDTCHGLDVTSYLIMPVQRIPRYVLLLVDLLKYTPPSHVDHNDLKAAVERTKEVADYVNEKKREAENLNQVLRVQERLGGKIDLLEDASRRFVREGVLIDLSGSDKRNRNVFLFNDTIVCARLPTKEFREWWKFHSPEDLEYTNPPPLCNNLTFKCSIPLQGCYLKEPSSNLQKLDLKWKHMFQLEWPQLKGESRIQTFIAPTYEIKQEWMGEIDENIMQRLEKQKTRAGPFTNYNYSTKRGFHNKADTIALQNVGTGKWKDRYISLKNGLLRCYKNENDMKVEKFCLEVYSCAVRLHRPSVKEFAFELLSCDQIYYFSVRSGEQLFEWIYAIRDAVSKLLVLKEKEEPKKLKFSVPPVLLQALTDDDNQRCADCDAPVQWANLTLGVFLCGECYTLHKILLFQSKLKNLIRGGRWKEEEAIQMAAKGNSLSSFQCKFPGTKSPTYGERVAFIKEKYETLLLHDDTPTPDPLIPLRSTLTPSGDVSEISTREMAPATLGKVSGRKSGWLILLNGAAGDKKYFYILKKCSLCYYKSEKIYASPKGVIDLHLATVSCSPSDPNGIEITMPGKIFHLFCPSPAERADWERQINAAKMRPRNRSSFRLLGQKKDKST